MSIQRYLMSSLTLAALFLPVSQSQAGLIPWAYDAIFGPPGSLQAWNANRLQYRAARMSLRNNYSVGYAPYSAPVYTSGYAGYYNGGFYDNYSAGYAPYYDYGYASYGCNDCCGSCNSCGTCGNCATGNCANGNCSTGFDPQSNTSEKPTPVSDPVSNEKKDPTPTYTPENPTNESEQPGFDPNAMGNEGFGSGPVNTPKDTDALPWSTPNNTGSSTSNKVPAPMETPDPVPKVNLGPEAEGTSTNPSLFIPPVSIDEKVANWRTSAVPERTIRRVAFNVPTVAHHQLPTLDGNQWVPPAPEVIVAQK